MVTRTEECCLCYLLVLQPPEQKLSSESSKLFIMSSHYLCLCSVELWCYWLFTSNHWFSLCYQLLVITKPTQSVLLAVFYSWLFQFQILTILDCGHLLQFLLMLLNRIEGHEAPRKETEGEMWAGRWDCHCCFCVDFWDIAKLGNHVSL